MVGVGWGVEGCLQGGEVREDLLLEGLLGVGLEQGGEALPQQVFYLFWGGFVVLHENA
jgi:hypothetical protein